MVATIVALPLVLPPTVLGFYLLVALGPAGLGGWFGGLVGLRTFAFTFEGLVFGSVIYSMPFVVQPIRNSFEAIGPRPLEVAATLGASPWDRFFTVAVPLSIPAAIFAQFPGVLVTWLGIGLVNLALPIAGRFKDARDDRRDH